MDRNELAKTLKILKNDMGPQKGFSLRRTLKALHDFQEEQVIYEYYRQLTEGTKNDHGREKIP
ncbi:MAG: hypothetical protein IKW45_05315 [Clostridia bacterium]|nr:hypothetical protein [Clostridia bacterium]